MVSVLAMITAFVAQPNDDPSVWQDFGRGPDGAQVLINPDTVIGGEAGPEAMIRVRQARAAANGAVLADYESVFNCSARTITRKLMGERDATGEIVSREDEGVPVPSVSAPAGTPLGRVLDFVCETAGG